MQGMVLGAAWNNDETQILAWGLIEAGYNVTIWDVENERIVARLGHDEVVRGARWNADDNRVLTWSDDGTVRMWVVPSGNDCVITTAITVRQRSLPSTEGDITGRLFEGDSSVAMGQAVGDDGFVWYQLIDASWVRSDVVEATGMCEQLVEVEVEE
jgi:WD40 repeat protein